MAETLGYHIVLSGYGLWLPGDERGHWSAKWDDELGLIEPHTLHSRDPIRQRMAEERLKAPPHRLSVTEQQIVADVVGRCAAESDWSVAACSIEATHTHLLLTYTNRNIDNTVKWLKDQLTKAIHRGGNYDGPVWCKGKWRGFVFEQAHWDNILRYIQRHNVRRGVGARPYAFLA